MKKHLTILAAGIISATVVSVVPAAATTAAPANDHLAEAMVVAELPFADEGSTKGATLELGEIQPTCSAITSSIWYSLSATEAAKLIARVSGTSRSAVAIYLEDPFDSMTEVACASGIGFKVPFAPQNGQTYLLQVGSVGSNRPDVDLNIVPDTWQEKVLHSLEQNVDVPHTQVDVIRIDGRPRANDPSMYDVTLDVGNVGQSITHGVLTFGLIDETIHQELVTIDRTAASVKTTISYRYDSAQQRCAVDDGPGSGCSVKAPVKDLGWVLRDGAAAELVIRVKVLDNKGLVNAERTLVVPFAGQVLGII